MAPTPTVTNPQTHAPAHTAQSKGESLSNERKPGTPTAKPSTPAAPTAITHSVRPDGLARILR